jgi:hypothetical protein
MRPSELSMVNNVATVFLAPVGGTHTFVTDSKTLRDFIADLEQSGITVHIV